MHTQGTSDVLAEGSIFIVGNSPLEVEDAGGAVARRLKTYQANKVSRSRVNLLKRGRSARLGRQAWLGPLANGLPGIFRWAAMADPPEVERLIIDTEENVKSFEKAYYEKEEKTDHMVRWIRAEIETRNIRTYLGCKVANNKYSDLAYGNFLYPTYVAFAVREGEMAVTVRKFSERLLEGLKKENYTNIKFGRDANLSYVEEIGIKEMVKTPEYLLSGPIDDTTTEITRNSNVEGVKRTLPKESGIIKKIPLYLIDSKLNPNLIHDYVSNLISKNNTVNEETVRRNVNKFVKTIDLSESAIDEYLKIFMDNWGIEDPTDSFVKFKHAHLIRSANHIA